MVSELIFFKTTHIKCNLTFHGLSLWVFTAVIKHWMHLLAHSLCFSASMAWTHLLLPKSLWPPTSASCLVFMFPHFPPSPVQPTHTCQSSLRKIKPKQRIAPHPCLSICSPSSPLNLLLYPPKHHGRPTKFRTASSVANAQTSFSAWIAGQDLAPPAAASPSDFFPSPCKVTSIQICLTAIQPISSLCLSFNLCSLPFTFLREKVLLRLERWVHKQELSLDS